VSRFTFAKGNAQKVLSLPVYALGSLASLLVPRRANHWVVGCGSGVGEGALALATEARARHPQLSITWLARNQADATAASLHGFDHLPLTSWRGFWATLRAEVLVVTHGFGDVNRFGTRGGFIVQLWHGIPLKLIHLDSPATMRSPILPNSLVIRRVLRALYRRAAQAIVVMPAASELSATRLQTAFQLPAERIVVTGDPRDDVLVAGDPAQRIAEARATLATRLTLPELGTARVILHAPTWRDGAVDPGIPTTDDWESIDAYLESTDSLLVIRPHPLSVGDFSVGARMSPRIHLLESAVQPDVMPLLPAFDALITDYSSIAYDFALTGREIFFLAPDVAAYEESRGLYEPYALFSGGTEVTSWSALLERWTAIDDDPERLIAVRAHTEAIAARHHAFRDGHNTARVYDVVAERVAARR